MVQGQRVMYLKKKQLRSLRTHTHAKTHTLTLTPPRRHFHDVMTNRKPYQALRLQENVYLN